MTAIRNTSRKKHCSLATEWLRTVIYVLITRTHVETKKGPTNSYSNAIPLLSSLNTCQLNLCTVEWCIRCKMQARSSHTAPCGGVTQNQSPNNSGSSLQVQSERHNYLKQLYFNGAFRTCRFRQTYCTSAMRPHPNGHNKTSSVNKLSRQFWFHYMRHRLARHTDLHSTTKVPTVALLALHFKFLSVNVRCATLTLST